MTWTVPAPQPVDGPLLGSDDAILRPYLTFQRVTLLNICSGLTPPQLATRPLPSTTLSLLGLLRHMAKVERIWFRIRAVNEPVEPLFDPALGKAADFDFGTAADAEDAVATLEQEWRAADVAVAGMSLDETFDLRGEPFSLRMVYVHMIAEYARHNGHADLLREALDGVTGR
jgi:hypothetical protein